MDFANYWFSSAAGGGGYEIGNSLRFRGSQYLQRSFGTPTSSTRGTWSFWVKLGHDPHEITFQGVVGFHCLVANSNNIWRWVYDPGSGSPANDLVHSASVGPNGWSTRVGFRDVSAWYHIVIRFDTTLGTAVDRLRHYYNGVQFAKQNSGDYGQNANMGWGQSGTHRIGNQTAGSGVFFKGYMAHIHYVDGQSLDPTQFGEYNSDGVWVPKEYSGSYGNNGFYLDFSDPSNIGADRSGNGNNWTATNFELTTTTSTNYDWVADSPTNNYCTFNPLDRRAVVGGTALESANLTAQNSSTTAYGGWYSTQAIDPANDSFAEANLQFGGTTYTWQFYLRSVDGSQAFRLYNENSGATIQYNGSTQTTTSRFSGGDEFGMRCTNGTVRFYRNGSQIYQFSQTLTSPAQTFILTSWNNREHWTWGQRPYINSNPTSGTGEEHWNTANMPVVAITDPGDHFKTVLYTGNGSTQSITGVVFQPDFVWIKGRNNSDNFTLHNAVIGATKYLYSNNNASEVTTTNSLTSFDSDGFSLGSAGITNRNNNTYVAWCWKADGSGSSNTAGSINSTVSANTTAGFSVVSYTGSGSNATVGHGLGVAPGMVIIKSRSNATEWIVYHSGVGATKFLNLDGTGSASTNSSVFNNTAPTNTTFAVGTVDAVNYSNYTYVAYCFADVEGYSKLGSYTGNGSSNGPFVYCGFRPAWVMLRAVNNAGKWIINDATRSSYNPTNHALYAEDSRAEESNGYASIDILSNGFKIRSNWSDFNTNGNTFIFAAFAEHPFGGENVSPAPAR